MKKLILFVLLAVLVGCASQKTLQTQKWHIEYLQEDLQEYKQKNIALADTVRIIRQTATRIIKQSDQDGKVKDAILQEFILITDITVADSLLKKYKMKYKFADGKVIGGN